MFSTICFCYEMFIFKKCEKKRVEVMRITHKLPIINDDTSINTINAMMIEWAKHNFEEYFYVPNETQYKGKFYEEILEIRKRKNIR